MNDIESLLRDVLAERAGDVEPDPDLARRARDAARRPAGGDGRVRWGLVALTTAAAVTAVVVAVHGLTDGSATPVPAAPTSSLPSTSGRVRLVTPTAVPAPSQISLTAGGPTASPGHPAGCTTFATASVSPPEPPPTLTTDGAVTTPPLASPSASGDGRPGDPYAWIALSPPPSVIAVMSDLDQVLDGVRFAGWSVDRTGRSVTVHVVEGPSAAAAEAVARSCARADAPIHLQRVARSRDQLTGLQQGLGASLPASLAGMVDPSLTSLDVERNRLVVPLDGTLTAAMKRDLWARYGDAVEVWLAGPRTLAEPAPAWANA